MLLKYFLKDFGMVPVAAITTGVTFVFTFHMHGIALLLLLLLLLLLYTLNKPVVQNVRYE
jgi:hypothetical protein